MCLTMTNLWVAAGDGDLQRVQHLLDSHPALSPNAPDPHSYTPMHAAASYGHLHVLAYLVSKGGDVNITDDDGDTPLYAVEDIDTARFLVDNGALIDRHNHHGISPIDHLREDFPAVAAYLQTRVHPQSSTPPAAPPQPSEYQQNLASETLTSALISSVHDIIQHAHAHGRDPDDLELEHAVTRTVLQGVLAGYQMSDPGSDRGQTAESPSKRPRSDSAS